MAKEFIYIGAWRDEKSETDGGINLFCFDSDEERIDHVATYLPGLSAGYMALSSDNRFLYAVNEIKGGTNTDSFSAELYSFSVNPSNGGLRLINKMPTNGAHANYVALDRTGQYAFVVNYGSEDTIFRTVIDKEGAYHLERIFDEGSVVVFRLHADGSIGDICSLIPHSDPPSRCYPRTQSSPHPHSINISPDNRMVIVTDRGCDLLVFYRFDEKSGKLSRISDFAIKHGLGPRNSVFHPSLPFFYIVHELYPFVSIFKYSADTSQISEICTIPVVPKAEIKPNLDDFANMPHPSDIRIHPNGRILSVSIRSRNSIALFEIEPLNGTLGLLQLTPSLGICPRSCCWNTDGQFLFVGNQQCGTISLLKFNEGSNQLSPLNTHVELERPVCIKAFN